jgi:hypothetical protein
MEEREEGPKKARAASIGSILRLLGIIEVEYFFPHPEIKVCVT